VKRVLEPRTKLLENQIWIAGLGVFERLKIRQKGARNSKCISIFRENRILKTHVIRFPMQLSLFPMKSNLEFGGTRLQNKRKSKRPLCTKRAIHLVMKSNQRKLSLNQKIIRETIITAGKKWGVTIYKIGVAIDHIHVEMRIRSREEYRRFIQFVSATIALKLKISWTLRPYTRIVSWGREFKRVFDYIEMNILEAKGFLPYQPRGRGSLKKRQGFRLEKF
jgi:hypothetical protein